MASIPDDLFRELHAELSCIMRTQHFDMNNNILWYECAFCMMDADPGGKIKHDLQCLGVRLMKAMDREAKNMKKEGG